MVELQLKGLFYNCDDKCFLGHKCKEHRIFMAIYKDVSNEDVNVSPMEKVHQAPDLIQSFDPLEVEPLISLNSLIDFSAPQTLKLIGYIKHRKFIILVDSGNTHNFMHRCITQEINFYICATNNF